MTNNWSAAVELLCVLNMTQTVQNSSYLDKSVVPLQFSAKTFQLALGKHCFAVVVL